MPLIVMGSLMMLIVGAIWAKYQYPTCGTDLASSRFILTSISSTTRLLSGNSCPGYDWSAQKSTFTAGERHFDITIPTYPKIAKTPTYIYEGIIGYALNSVPIYAPGSSAKADAVKVQSVKFDQCGGSDSNPVGFTFNLPITGVYRYFSMPGDGSPMSHATPKDTNFKLCSAAANWYNDTARNAHSPITGFMADGIPIYGPRGRNGSAPSDLDACGGHSSDLPFYHYHFQATYPYSVGCLRGCLDGQFNDALDGSCNVNTTATLASNYSTIANLTVRYGGVGVNSTDWSGPACLLIFGFIIFIPGMLCCICMMCAKSISKMHDKEVPLGDQGDSESEYESEQDPDYEWVSVSDDGEARV